MLKMNSTVQKKTLSLVIALLLMILSPCAFASDLRMSVYVRSAPLETQANAQNGMVRVYLASLGNPSSLDLTISGSYSLSITNERLASGAKLRVQFSPSSGKLTVIQNGQTLNAGNGFSLRRYNASGTNGVLIAQSKDSQNPYPGDLSFEVVASGGSYVLYTVAHVYIEEYLYGVLPYEMGNGSGLEALKAQAVAARTYTVRMMERRASNRYDVKDTTSDQVYRGTPSGNANCKAAVDATKGIVLMYGSSYITTYYAASNGGQTEIARDGSAAPYMTVKDDPFDYNNTSSTVKRATIHANLQNSQNSSAFLSLLKRKASVSLQRMGYLANTENISLLTLTDVTPHTPKYTSPSRLYTQMDFTFTVSVFNAAGSVSTVTLTESCSIFNELEGLFGMSIQSMDNELWTVQKKGTSFELQARRYGHGMGMSQRGAMHMDKLGYTYDQILGFYYEGCNRVQHSFTHTILNSSTGNQDITIEPPADLKPAEPTGCTGKVVLPDIGGLLAIRAQQSTSAKIVGTASNGALLEVLVKNDSWSMIKYGDIVGYVPTTGLSINGEPTGQPQNVTDILGFATVTANDYVNLRSQNSMSAKIVGTAPFGAILTVFEKNGNWARVQYGSISAYVNTNYISSVWSEYPDGQIANGSKKAVVTTQSGNGTVNLRQSASTAAKIVDRLAAGKEVTVHSDDGSWCMISTASVKGYMLRQYLTYVDDLKDGNTSDNLPENEGNTESFLLFAVVTTKSGSLNLRVEASGKSRILTTIPQNARISVAQKGDEWSRVQYKGYDGYVMSQFLAFENIKEDSSDNVQDLPESLPDVLTAVVSTPGGSLNMRSKASGNSQILDRIPPNTVVNILERGSEWCRVEYLGVKGYVMSSFLRFEAGTDKLPPVEDSEAIDKPAEAVTAFVQTQSGSLNMRTQPSLRAGICTTIPRAASVVVLEKGEEWCTVRYQNFEGYVMTQYLSFDAPADDEVKPQKPESSTKPSVSEYAWVTTPSGSLNMRSAADGNASVLMTIPRSSKVMILENGAEWTKISYQSITGYVMTRFLTKQDPSALPEQDMENPQESIMDETLKPVEEQLYGYVFDDTEIYPMCVEEAPLLTVPAAARAEMVMIGETWSCIRYEGTTGYCLTRKLVVMNE